MTSAALTRLARRTARGGGWRHVLIVGLVAIAVAAAVATAIGARSARPSIEQRVTWTLGDADALVISWHDGEVTYDQLPPELQRYVDETGAPRVERAGRADVPSLIAGIDPGARVVPLVEAWGVPLGDEVGDAVITDVSDPLLEGLFLFDAPAPSRGEVLVSPRALSELGADVGDAVELRGAGSVTVVGTVVDPDRLDRMFVLAPPSTPAPAFASEETRWLVELDAVTLEEFASAFATGADAPVETRASVAASWLDDVGVTEEPTFIGTVVGVALLAQVALVSAAAFATGARRRLRELGLLGATGADPGQIHGLVLREALVLGVLGGAVGAGLGVLLAWLGRPVVASIANTHVSGLDVHALDLVAPALLGAGAAVVAAFVPARTAARVPVATALAGRMPVRTVPRWVAPGAVLAAVAGLALLAVEVRRVDVGTERPVLIALGAVLAIAGAATLAVPILGLLGRVADRLPVSWRLVVRDAARQRTRSGAAVGALTVVLVVPVILMTGFATDQARWGRGAEEDVRTDLVSVSGPWYAGYVLPPTEPMLDEVQTVLPDVERRADLTLLGSGGDHTWVDVTPIEGDPRHLPIGGGPVALASEEVLEVLGLGDLAPHLADGGVVALLPRGFPDALVPERGLSVAMTVRGAAPEGSVEPLGVSLSATLVAVRADHVPSEVPSVLVSEATGQFLGLEPVGGLVLLDLVSGVSFDDASSAGSGPTSTWSLGVAPAVWDTEVTNLPFVLSSAIAAAVALVITAMTSALAATESDRDLRLMTAVGGEPRLRRRFHGMQSGLHAALAGVLAVPTGLLVFRAATVRQVEGPWLVVPWSWLALVAVGVPLLVALAHRTLMRSAPVEAPRRIA